MNNSLKKTGRIHGLDALRAVMMLLGVVLHSSETYNLGADPFWPKDPNATHIFQNYLNSMIHIFRMPLFFLLAGFFGALLFYERGTRAMLENRFKRLVLPFLVFLMLLHPIVIWAINYASDTFNEPIAGLLHDWKRLPRITYHLWFLYYLILITTIMYGLALLMRRLPLVSAWLMGLFDRLFSNRSAFIPLFSIIVFLMLVWIWDTWAPTPLDFVPDIKMLLFYGLYYGIGWMLFKQQKYLHHFLRFDRLFLLLAIVVFTLKFFFRSYVDDVLYGALNAIIIWFFVFGFIGTFLRYCNKGSHTWRYISDASYWVYLVHLPLTFFFPAVIAGLALPAFAKFLIVMTLTSLVCFISYHFLVRASFIGQFLNGRKYPLKKTKVIPFKPSEP